MAITLQGAAGGLRWGYRSAGTLRAWRVGPDDEGHASLTATVDRLDDFAASQRPLRFVVMHPTGVWTWPITELQIANGALTARLGSREGSR